MTTTRTTGDDLSGLGANERAILEKIRWAPARRLATRIVRTKMRLQFNGWLQYLLPVPFLLGLLLIAGVSSLIGIGWLATSLLVAASLLALIVVFDIVTSKWQVRFPESRPPRNDDLDPFDLFRARRSCRSFQTRAISDADRGELLLSVERHLGAPKLGEAPLRLEYMNAPLTVWPTVNGSEFLVAIVPKTYDRTAIIDVGRTLQRVVMDATRMGLGTCWIGPGADHESVIGHLGDRFDPASDQIVCVCAVGYRSRYVPLFVRIFNRGMKRRRPFEGLFYADFDLQHPLDVTAPPFDRFGRTFEACQWSPSSYNGQTSRAVLEVGPGGDVSAVHFLAITASRYYAPVAAGIWCANWELGCEALGIEGHPVRASSTNAPEPLPHHDVTWRPHGVG